MMRMVFILPFNCAFSYTPLYLSCIPFRSEVSPFFRLPIVLELVTSFCLLLGFSWAAFKASPGLLSTPGLTPSLCYLLIHFSPRLCRFPNCSLDSCYWLLVTYP